MPVCLLGASGWFSLTQNKERCDMALVRTFARVQAEGRLDLPASIRTALGLKEQDIVELKVDGPSQSRRVVMSKPSNCR